MVEQLASGVEQKLLLCRLNQRCMFHGNQRNKELRCFVYIPECVICLVCSYAYLFVYLFVLERCPLKERGCSRETRGIEGFSK